MFEPFFDQYLPSVTFNGGKPVYVPLHPNLDGEKPNSSEWKIDFDELRCVKSSLFFPSSQPTHSRAITPRAKIIIINTPQNPVGKVFSREELEKIAAIAEEFNLLVMSDEVVRKFHLVPFLVDSSSHFKYDCLVYDGKEHVRFATLPGMWDRTVTVLSAGSERKQNRCPSKCMILILFLSFPEAFAATGWRVGWLIGPESIIKPTLAACTRIVFCSNSPLQEAAAGGLEQARSHGFFEKQVTEYQERRDVLLSAFDRIGLKYSLPEGTYFVLVVRRYKKELATFL